MQHIHMTFACAYYNKMSLMYEVHAELCNINSQDDVPLSNLPYLCLPEQHTAGIDALHAECQ